MDIQAGVFVKKRQTHRIEPYNGILYVGIAMQSEATKSGEKKTEVFLMMF